MRDPRIAILAANLLDHSIQIKRNEKLVIEVVGEGSALAKELITQAYAKGAFPFYRLTDEKVQREWMKGLTDEQINEYHRMEESFYGNADACIMIRGNYNKSEMNGTPIEKIKRFREILRPLHLKLENNAKWVVLNYPTASMAQKANMSTEAFEDFFFEVCTLDYKKMHDTLLPLYDLMMKTDRVRITGPGTELTFSIKEIPVRICSGRRNIPDGEIYTAPVKDSVNGTITYNTTSQYLGKTFENIRFTFKDGKIVEATSSNTAALNEILDSDEGARYIGEFSLAVNPYILQPMNDVLFDEKIAGSFHFTPGNAYEAADNGNRSVIHWDIVNIQRLDYGGGEIWFDDVLIRKDGLFLPDLLLGLNPENLKEPAVK